MVNLVDLYTRFSWWKYTTHFFEMSCLDGDLMFWVYHHDLGWCWWCWKFCWINPYVNINDIVIYILMEKYQGGMVFAGMWILWYNMVVSENGVPQTMLRKMRKMMTKHWILKYHIVKPTDINTAVPAKYTQKSQKDHVPIKTSIYFEDFPNFPLFFH